MKISTGKVGFPLEFDNGEKEKIYFNPNDRGIQKRIQEFEGAVAKRVKQIEIEKYKSRFNEKMQIDFDFENPEKLFEMSPEELTEIQNRLSVANDIEDEYNKAVKEELDVVFNSKISDTVFKYCEPFDVVLCENEKGEQVREVFILQFLKWLMVEMKKHTKENEVAIKKHTSKYMR